MARFETSGLDETISEMKRLGQLSGDAAKDMLLTGAEEVRNAWRQSAQQHGHRDTGDMIASIGYSRRVKEAGDALSVDIYPQGRRKDGTRQRHAEIAFILHYGTSKIPESRWVDDADRISEQKAIPAMIKVWDKFIESGGAR